MISGYINTSISSGEALGPVISGILTEVIGFRKSLDVYATTLVIFTVLFVLCNNNIFVSHKPTQKDDFVQDTELGELKVEQPIAINETSNKD